MQQYSSCALCKALDDKSRSIHKDDRPQPRAVESNLTPLTADLGESDPCIEKNIIERAVVAPRNVTKSLLRGDQSPGLILT